MQPTLLRCAKDSRQLLTTCGQLQGLQIWSCILAKLDLSRSALASARWTLAHFTLPRGLSAGPASRLCMVCGCGSSSQMGEAIVPSCMGRHSPEGWQTLGSNPGRSHTQQSKHETGCGAQQEEMTLADDHASQEEVDRLDNLALHAIKGLMKVRSKHQAGRYKI